MLQRQRGVSAYRKALSSLYRRPSSYFLSPGRRWLTVCNAPKSVKREPRKEASKSPIVTTFISSKLRPSDYVDLSGETATPCYLGWTPDRKRDEAPVPFTYSYKKVTPLPFPPSTRGFLYFHYAPEVHVASGQLRFRLVETPDPAAFSAGTDLMSPERGAPWGLHLLTLRMTQKYSPVYRSLVQDGAITPEMDLEISKLAEDPNAGARRHYLDSVTDPFFLNLSCTLFSINLLEPGFISNLAFPRPFVTSPPPSPKARGWDQSPYSGTAHVRFELVHDLTLSGKPTVELGMRVLKFIQPPNPGDRLFQKEGELLKKWNPVARQEVLWRKSLRFLSKDAISKLMLKYPA